MTDRSAVHAGSPSQVQITLAGMRFHVRVGVLPHEREISQPLEIDLSVRLTPGIHSVLDYRALYAAAREVVETGPLEYLESVGSALVSRVLLLDGVLAARVAVRKPHVALDGPVAYAEVVVERVRG